MRKSKAYLELLLKEEIVEGQPEHSIFSRKARTSLQDILQILHRAARDPGIAALSLILGPLNSGWARSSDLRRGLGAFRRSGKPIYCFLQEAGNEEYYIATACDHIFMPPAAHLNLVGLSAEAFFLRDVLERFGVSAQLQAIGEYKSAAEMFTRTGMSPPAREQMDLLLDDSHEELCRALRERGFSSDEIAAKIDSGPYTAREAMVQKLVDGICYQDAMADKLTERFGKGISSLPAEKYFKGDGFFKHLLTFHRPRIAVINIEGHIDSGESRRNQAGRIVTGADTVGMFLDHARQSKRIRAVLLRINSPGGSGLASDFIWRKVSLLSQTKPVVVSFGNVAASGGYYIATPAACIFAESMSITGSIGVLAGKFVARELLSRLNIRRESLRRGLHAEYESLFSEFTQAESERLHQQILEFYREDFVRKVADGRKLDDATVDQVGRGRVWSGRRAKDLKLIDETGGLLEAIQKARELARIPEAAKIRVVHYYRHRKLWERFIPDLRTPIMAGFLPQSALDAASMAEELRRQAVYLVMPYQIHIR